MEDHGDYYYKETAKAVDGIVLIAKCAAVVGTIAALIILFG